jgi:O-Antigen ligase
MSATSLARFRGRGGSPPRIPWGRLTWLAILAAIFAGASYKLGVDKGLLALAGVLLIPLLLNYPRASFVIWVSAFVIAENTADWNISIFARLYDKTPGLYFSPNFLLLLITTIGVLLDVKRPQVRARVPHPFGAALILVFLAILFGYANAFLGPGIKRFALLGSIEDYGMLLLPPLIVVNLVRDEAELRKLMTFLAALTVLKALLGIFAVVAGLSSSEVGLGRLSYLAPTANWMTMVYILAVGAARMAKAKLPGWILWSTPLVIASLLLSQRRAFWLATAFALALLILIGSGRTGRRLLVPAILTVGIAGYLAVASGALAPVQGQLISRATSITPTKVSSNKEDRYRLAELKNTWPAVRSQPLEGLGIGVPWREISPLPFEYPFNHYFAHMAGLYWWMTCGLMGLAAYLLLMGTAVVTGIRLWRRNPTPVLRAVALALGLGVAGMMVDELTTTVVGADARGTAAIAITIGILAVIYRLTNDENDAFGERTWSGDPLLAVPRRS